MNKREICSLRDKRCPAKKKILLSSRPNGKSLILTIRTRFLDNMDRVKRTVMREKYMYIYERTAFFMVDIDFMTFIYNYLSLTKITGVILRDFRLNSSCLLIYFSFKTDSLSNEILKRK